MRLIVTLSFILVVLSIRLCPAQIVGTSPLSPFPPDDHTLLLYHFDEGQGTVAHDSSKYGYDGEIHDAVWTDKGRFGKALEFNGTSSTVFRKMTEAITNLKQFTVEAWFNQDNPSGRQFLIGKDVTFHFEIDEGMYSSISLYNHGGEVKNAEGLPHKQISTGLDTMVTGHWGHLATSYDGKMVSFWYNGVLKSRVEAPKDFSIGTNSRGIWIGCYIGMDYYFSGLLDEVRISDCERYDPDHKLAPGGHVFDMPARKIPVKAVRVPQKTDLAKLNVELTKLYGGNASGWVYLKSPGKKAAIVGKYEMNGLADKATANLALDVSDEVAGDGLYTLALEPVDANGYIEVTSAELTAGGKAVATWAGHAKTRRTFQPPVLVPLQAGKPAAQEKTDYAVLLSPATVDRLGGELEVSDNEGLGAPRLTGRGLAEWWLTTETTQAYRVYLRYAAGTPRPCDFVIDGEDLHPYNMVARDATGGNRERDALWCYQGTTTLKPGLHWIRIQDLPPDIYGIALQPVTSVPAYKVPRERYPVPKPDFLTPEWQGEVGFYAPPGTPGAPVRSTHKVACDLEPYGRLRATFQGTGGGHVFCLRLVDAKGDEKLLWHMRDAKAGEQKISVPISFEGNDVFDPGHVVAVCLDVEGGTISDGSAITDTGLLRDPVFDRRDTLAAAKGEAEAIEAAKALMADTERRLAGGTPAPRGEAPRVSPLVAPAFKPWTKPIIPEEHPLYVSTEPKPVMRATLGPNLHFTGARGVDENTLNQYHKFYNFGDICWPHIGICPQRRDYKTDEDYQKALAETEKRLVDVNKRGLYLWDIWGYVPFGEAGPTPRVAPEHDAMLKRVFGDRFFGYDNGEQDGRYIGSYADRGSFTDRKGGWADFVKWDEGICNDSMNYMDATGSLNFSHYYGERGDRTLGLETAQGLPSDTMEFAFLRGAAKQYGRLTTQATSIWNRFGYNMYGDRHTEGGNGYGLGPNKGCSVSLHNRLFFCSYTGGDSICGTEAAQFTNDTRPDGAPELSRLGKGHLDIANWVRQHPDRGVMQTPVAFMLDFYNGWNPPRHLYRGDKYKIWGKLPYEKGDYLTDAMFRMVWPGYEDGSFLRNERGFLCPTPYGDIFDVLTSRCVPEVLKQYAAIMLLGDVEMTPDVVAKLTAYVQAGGDLILDAKRAAAFPADLTGVTLGAADQKGRMTRVLSSGKTVIEQPYTYTAMTLQSAKTLVVSEGNSPVLTVNVAGKGRVIVCAADNWLTDKLTYANPDLVNMEPPYTLLNGVKAALDGYFATFSPVTVSPGGLTVRTNLYEKDPKRMLVGLLNNDLFADWKGVLRVKKGVVSAVKEIWRGKDLAAGSEIPLTIPAGEVAMVEVRLK